MSKPSNERGLVRSSAWQLRAGKGRIVLRRTVSGVEIALSGRRAASVAAALATLDTPRSEAEIVLSLRAGLGEQAEGFMELLQEHEVLRPYWDAHPTRVRGSGALFDVVLELVREGGWKLPSLIVGSTWPISAAPDTRRTEVALLFCGGDLVASLSGARPCPRCLLLRRLAHLGNEGEEQSAWLLGRGASGERTALRALAAEALILLQKEPLAPGQAVVVHPGEGAAWGVFLVHPDCDLCRARPAPDKEGFTRTLLDGLDAKTARRPTPGSRRALVDPLLGPLMLEVKEGGRGRYPFDGPFVWGSVRLSRWMNEKAISMSTWGGMHATHPDPAMAELIGLSEGVERLLTRSARPHEWAGDRAYCLAVDLVRRAPKLVPFEDVVVAIPKPLYPEAQRIEPFYSGAASHVTLDQAVVHATLELLGRDAFMISWYRRRALPELSWPKAKSATASARMRYLRARRIRLELFELTLDGPVCSVLLRATALRGRGCWPKGGALLAAGVGFDAMAALEHALGLICGQYISLALEPSPDKDPLDPAAIERMTQTTRFWPLLARYLDPRNAGAHAFLGQGRKRFEEIDVQAPASIAEKMNVLKRYFEEQSMSWLVTRLTDEPAFEAGFEVVKVIVPGLVGLSASREEVAFSLPRMQRAYPDALLDTPNPDPHPLY